MKSKMNTILNNKLRKKDGDKERAKEEKRKKK